MLNANQLLNGIPDGLRQPLIDTYIQIARNYAEHRWEPSELNGGKLCEIVFTILDGAISGAYAAKPKKPGKLVEACRALEQRPSDPAIQIVSEIGACEFRFRGFSRTYMKFEIIAELATSAEM
jgi:hypothetical protein